MSTRIPPKSLIRDFDPQREYLKWELKSSTSWGRGEEHLRYQALIITQEEKSTRGLERGKAIKILSQIEKFLNENTLMVFVEGSVSSIAQTVFQGFVAKRGWCGWTWDVLLWRCCRIESGVIKLDRIVKNILSLEANKPDYEIAFWNLRQMLWAFGSDQEELSVAKEMAKQRNYLIDYIKKLEKGEASAEKDQFLERSIQELCKRRDKRIENNVGEAAELLFYGNFFDPEVQKRAAEHLLRTLELRDGPRSKPIGYTPEVFLHLLAQKGCFDSALRIADKIENKERKEIEKRSLSVGKLAFEDQVDEAIEVFVQLRGECSENALGYLQTVWGRFQTWGPMGWQGNVIWGLIDTLTVKRCYQAAIRVIERYQIGGAKKLIEQAQKEGRSSEEMTQILHNRFYDKETQGVR